MTTLASAEVPEVDARGSIAEGYAVVRAALHSTFVPTIYRRLAIHPEAFAIAVAVLPEVVRIGDDAGFVALACSTARAALPAPGDFDAAALRELPEGEPGPGAVLGRYRRANPLNLLFSLSICGLAVPPKPAVMAPPLPISDDADLWADIEACHRAAFVPGVWRELAPWPAVLNDLWPRTRQLAAVGGVVGARDAVRQLAITVLSGTSVEHGATRARDALGPDAAAAFDWFPTGIATMVAEVEWLTWYSGTPHQGKDRP